MQIILLIIVLVLILAPGNFFYPKPKFETDRLA
jgi:hypothetical protein